MRLCLACLWLSLNHGEAIKLLPGSVGGIFPVSRVQWSETTLPSETPYKASDSGAAIWGCLAGEDVDFQAVVGAFGFVAGGFDGVGGGENHAHAAVSFDFGFAEDAHVGTGF